jgi:SagB-type dehydrogenase family enzyme
MAKKGAGETFQEESKYSPGNLGGGPDHGGPPKPFKEYPESKRVSLPPPKGNEVALEEVLKKRRSVRHYQDRAMDLDQVSYLLWAATGISKVEHGFGYRTAPSAGGLYPIETYLVVNNVDGLDPGIYHYNIRDHELELLKKGDFGSATAKGALGQAMPRTAPVTFVFTAIYQRSKWKYGQRAYRYIYMDAAHIAENLALAAVSLDLGTVQVGALFDDELNELIEVDPEKESVIYLMPVGYPK